MPTSVYKYRDKSTAAVPNKSEFVEVLLLLLEVSLLFLGQWSYDGGLQSVVLLS